MARQWTWDQAEKMAGGTSLYFKIEDGETREVRFLYNTLSEITPVVVHSINKDQNYATILCGRSSDQDPIDACKWCASGDKGGMKVVIPIYDVKDNSIVYWIKAGSWVKKTLMAILQQIPEGQPISGIPFMITRTGKGLDTTYTVNGKMGAINDMKTKEVFGEIKDIIEAGVVKDTDYEFPVNTTNNNMTSTRRTTDVF